jgi:hypothetical protein
VPTAILIRWLPNAPSRGGASQLAQVVPTVKGRGAPAAGLLDAAGVVAENPPRRSRTGSPYGLVAASMSLPGSRP